MKENNLEKIEKWMEEGCSGRALTLKYTNYMDKFLAGILHFYPRYLPGDMLQKIVNSDFYHSILLKKGPGMGFVEVYTFRDHQ